MKNLLLILRGLRIIPHYVFFKISKNSEVISFEINHWLRILNIKDNLFFGFVQLMLFYPEFRNLFYYRIGHKNSKYISFLCPKMSSLFINCKNIGRGLFIQHGFATIIEAQSLGENCWINQQVTIGYKNKTDCPTIKNNVTICAGAKIIGDVTIGNNSIVGANAVVIKSVPDNVTVVGIPAYIIKKDGVKLFEKL